MTVKEGIILTNYRGKEAYLEVTKHAERQPICGDSHSHSVFMWA